jgi:DNA recombination-dependent growth factor C
MDILPWYQAADSNRLNKEEKFMAEEPKLADELKKMEYEPLLPIEKKLIGWSIGLGVGGLAVLVWISYTFFPAGH